MRKDPKPLKKRPQSILVSFSFNCLRHLQEENLDSSHNMDRSLFFFPHFLQRVLQSVGHLSFHGVITEVSDKRNAKKSVVKANKKYEQRIRKRSRVSLVQSSSISTIMVNQLIINETNYDDTLHPLPCCLPACKCFLMQASCMTKSNNLDVIIECFPINRYLKHAHLILTINGVFQLESWRLQILLMTFK